VVSTARFLARRLSWPMRGRLVVSKLGQRPIGRCVHLPPGSGLDSQPRLLWPRGGCGHRVPSAMTDFAINPGVDHRDSLNLVGN
jgi:hypothetical protein